MDNDSLASGRHVFLGLGCLVVDSIAVMPSFRISSYPFPRDPTTAITGTRNFFARFAMTRGALLYKVWSSYLPSPVNTRSALIR